MEKNKVYLSLGGNIGDRKGYIQKAIKMIGKINGIKKSSSNRAGCSYSVGK